MRPSNKITEDRELKSHLRLAFFPSLRFSSNLRNSGYKTKGTVRPEENKDPRSHQVVTKNGMAGV